VLAESGNGVIDAVYLIASVGPVVAVGVLCFYFFRAARRNDERERTETVREPET
jgi:hypothetical protein